MSDPAQQDPNESKSGVIEGENPVEPDPYFKVGDSCQMLVSFDAHGENITTYKFFTIRAIRLNEGEFEYQLDDKDTGQQYEGESWYLEADLQDA